MISYRRVIQSLQNESLYCLVVGAVLIAALSCTSTPKEEKNIPKVTALHLVVSPELHSLLHEIQEAFEKEDKKLGDGSILRLALSEIPDITAAKGISTGTIQTDGWIFGPSELIDYVNTTARGLGSHLVECTPLFSSPLILGMRKSDADAYLFDQTTSPLDALSERPHNAGLQWYSNLTMPSPEESGIGLASLLSMITSASKGSLPSNVEEIKSLPRLSEYMALLSHVEFLQPHQRLAALPKRAGVIPGLFTTAQQLRVTTPTEGETLVEAPIAAATQHYEYTLCTVDAPWVTLPKRVGLRIFGKFFALPTIIKHVSDFGFQIPPSSQPQSKELLPLIQIVLDTWRQLLSPSSLTYVIDASERMPIEVLERVKFQVNRAREHRVSPELTSVIGVNDEARILVTSKNDPTTATEAIANLTRSGTGILQGGVRVALDLYKSSPSPLSRSGIIIITTAAESQGTVVPSILDDMLLGENPVDVSVIKIAVDPAVDTISIKQLGLTSYYTVPLGSLETTMEKIRLSW